MCGAPWDLEVTPNFAKLLEDAELPWPPASPINWPLKDW
jgi:adenylate cyclase